MKNLQVIADLVLKKLAVLPDGHECAPSHPAMTYLVERGFVQLSDAVLSPTGEKAKDCWAKITKRGLLEVIAQQHLQQEKG